MMAAMSPFTAGLVQLTSGDEVAANIVMAEALIRDAAAAGAHLICTPEMTSLMEPRTAELFAKARAETDDPALARLRTVAAELGRHLLIGSLPIKTGADKVANRSYLIGPDGAILARYDKIHLFDVDLPNGESHRESKNYGPGGAAVTADLPFTRLGMTVCYDLRFAALYRALAKAGALVMTVPAAFTRVTGEAHWHILLRARAIECGAFILAPGQCGTHPSGRQTFGHSLIVAPWGEVLADGGTAPGIVTAHIDPQVALDVRGRIPALKHDRPFTPPQGAP